MAKKKNFGVGGERNDGGDAWRTQPSVPTIRRDQVRVEFSLPNGSEVRKSFANFIGHGFDEVVHAYLGVCQYLGEHGGVSPYTLESCVKSGIGTWFEFCVEQAKKGTVAGLVDVTGEFVREFAKYLSTRQSKNGELWSRNSCRTAFSKNKTILMKVMEFRLVPNLLEIPRCQFAGATSPSRKRKYIEPLSDSERDRLLRPLTHEVAKIQLRTHPGSELEKLSLCAFFVFLKTGGNLTPVLEMPRELDACFIEHPTKNRKILVLVKRRAGKHTITPIPESEKKVVSFDVFRLCEFVKEATKSSAKAAVGTDLEDWLWLYETKNGKIRGLSGPSMHQVGRAFAIRHGILRDDGTPLRLSSQLFRNSKVNRIWRASRGDLHATSRSVSNTPAAAEGYLSVTAEQRNEHRLAGEVLVGTLSGIPIRDETPHSGCRDSEKGELAPKTGEPCVDFISCFRCKSQVIIQADLWKLFSFYWAVYRQREVIGRDRWQKRFAWVVRIIDRDIAEKFSKKIVKAEKERARKDPHPMWMSFEAVAALRSIA